MLGVKEKAKLKALGKRFGDAAVLVSTLATSVVVGPLAAVPVWLSFSLIEGVVKKNVRSALLMCAWAASSLMLPFYATLKGGKDELFVAQLIREYKQDVVNTVKQRVDTFFPRVDDVYVVKKTLVHVSGPVFDEQRFVKDKVAHYDEWVKALGFDERLQKSYTEPFVGWWRALDDSVKDSWMLLKTVFDVYRKDVKKWERVDVSDYVLYNVECAFVDGKGIKVKTSTIHYTTDLYTRAVRACVSEQ